MAPTRTRQVTRKNKARPVADIERPRTYAFYGRAGTGKTTLASTFPGPILLLDCKDEGTDSVADIEGLEVWDCFEHDDIEDAYWYLKQNPDEYKTVVVDTVTQWQQMIVEEISGERLKKSGKHVGDWGTMTKQDWGSVSSRLKTWITNYRDLPMEVIFLCQERTFNLGDEEDDSVLDPEVGPALSPSVKSHLNAAVSVIGNTMIRTRNIVKKDEKGRKTKKQKIEHCLRIGPNSTYITKVRKPKSIELPEFIVDPTYEDIIEIIKGE